MIKTLKLLKILFIFLVSNICFSQGITEFKFVDIKEGITKRAVSYIKQDSQGFIWFGTNGAGLYRYDGINYKLYEYKWDDFNSIDSGLIHSIFEDTTGNFWITTDEGLNLYNKELDNFKRLNLNSAFSAKENHTIQIKAIAELNKEELILGSYGYGLFKMNKSTFKSERIPFGERFGNVFLINVIVKTSENNFFIGTSNGLFQLSGKDNYSINKVLADVSIESLFKDSEENLWIGTSNKGLFKKELKTLTSNIHKFKITDKRILSIIEYKNHIICGSENDGVFVLNKKGEIKKNYLYDKYNPSSLKSNSVWSLLKDNENRIWLGFYNKGVAVVDELYNKFKAIESVTNNVNSLSANSVSGIQEDSQGNLWITTDGGGIDIYNKNGLFNHLNNSVKNRISKDIQTIYIDSKEQIWVGTWTKGLFKINAITKQIVNYNTENSNLTSNRVLSIQEDSKGKLWIGTFLNGLHYLDPQTKSIYHCNTKDFLKYELHNADIRKLYVDTEDIIWLGTTDGLFSVTQNKENLKVTSLRDKMSVKLRNHSSTHRILSITQSKDGLIWVGTDGAGLFSYFKSIKKFNWYNETDGFNEMYVSSIVEDERENIWVAGTSGITKLDRKNNIGINFTKDDGLLLNDFNYNAVLKSKSGNLYFGGYQGVNYFHPDKMKKNKIEPKLFFTDFKLFNKSISPSKKGSLLSKSISCTKNITLKHSQSVFTIDYIGLNYTRPEKHQYAYFMEGVDPEWNYVGNNKSATYTNLSAGEYVFNVKARNNDGVWTKKPLKLNIKVLPPWYLTNWAYVVYLVLFVGLIFAINWILQQRFKEKQAVKFERDKRIQEEKLNNKKLQFFTNISHEFRTPLTLILNPLQDLLKDKKIEFSEEANEKLNIIQKNAERLNRLINELMDFRKLKSNKIQLKPEKVNIISFVNEVVSCFKEEAAHRKIELVFESKSENFQSYIDKQMIEKVLFNIISNAFKVTPDKGKIIVLTKKIEKPKYLELVNPNKNVEAFEIIVKDTGKGLSKKELTKIFERFYQVNKLNKGYYGSTGIGLEVVKDFIELHKGEIEVNSKVNKGTQFRVILPIINKNPKRIDEEAEIDEKLSDVILNIDTSLVSEIKQQDSVNKKAYTLLIVEDNTELRNYLKSVLEKTYKIITASNGEIGLKRAVEKLPDVILTDVVMPEMDGVELCKAIKSNLKTSHIPLLMLSAKSMVEDKVKGLDSGADAYISKPFNMEILKSTLTQLISSRQILFNKFYTGVSNKTKENTTTLDNQFIQKALKYIELHIADSNLTAESLAEEMFLSRSQLYRKLKTLTGTSVNEFIRNVRLEKAKQLIESKQYAISEIVFKVGFASPSYFTKCFKKRFGKLPTEVE
ncbi:two-component regulator propeller domain-containing protein [Lutibacter sp. TH_r2]|uniref:hybrid sensor histidine kinase/response regulator n=1 Tax=Lutibacter sp. TH_r2 TaxID=3082083 RepID=UPI0029539114|nr:two-component regulator propeller domain-containing protein [Lutibacter sp. TH_r2]MDV7187978.1 two-component regulator propeller domain-containing protein [Lutibacter sp. TH_r2]